MKNKRSLLALFSGVMCLSLMTSCGGGESEVAKVITDAETLSYEELLVKAKEEIGENTLETYGNSSQLEKALTAFTEATGIKTHNTKKGDAQTYTELTTSFQGKTYVADMVLLQDGNKLQNEMLNAKYLENYIPKEHKDKIAKDDLEPTAAVYLNKVFMYNNTNFNGSNGNEATAGQLTHYMTNVWQVAGTSADEGHISNVSFKPATTENVNMNFLVMLTSPEWVTKLEAAYKDFYKKDYVAEKEYKNIGYKWIAEFLKNSQGHSSDGTACKDVAKGQSGSMALVNLNKNKDLKDTGVGKEDKANLTYVAMEEENTLKGFGGFCYKMYAMVASNAKYPYTACAFINYLLSKEGFEKAWGAKDGYYSTNPDAAIASTDKALSWWKQRLVIENPEYVSKNYTDVFRFIQQFEGK